MKLTFRQLKVMEPALTKLSGLSLPLKLSIDVTRIIKAVQAELEIFTEQHVALVKKFADDTPGVENHETGEVTMNVPDEKMDDFKKEIAELLNYEVTLDIKKINIDELAAQLDGDDNVKMSPAELYTLDCLLE